ncbi:unnamed protein product [Adineta ricciae]|uniref:Uncharacterized protein n=1 Tax=Adineta ricciae TaxID=249248 RepID=A0A814X7X6_ADIRI|nr:unnamed protein product [Adineta ricciae]CAF1215659.1 unnamed protein product [Adineta ricciae]
MLSFIRKRLPSKDRSDEHFQHIKSNQDEDRINRSQSNNELNGNSHEKKKEKKKKRSIAMKSSSTLNELDTIPIQNQSYSDVDYFPMMSGAFSQQSNDHNKTSSLDRNLMSDCYLNSNDVMKTNNQHIKYAQPVVTKTRAFDIPVVDCRTQPMTSYKDVDHQRTKALQDVMKQRIDKK